MAWINLSDLDVTENVNIIHCDTRDFHCSIIGDYIDTKDGKNRQISRVFYKPDYQIPATDIKDWLLGLRKMSGGYAGWRMLNFIGVDCDGWLKYIRLYRNPKNKKMFIVCNRDSEPILWRNCTEENLDKEYLCVQD